MARLTGTDKPGATRKGRTTRATSCGGVVIMANGGEPQLCIGMRRRERSGVSWTLPKGTPDGAETVEQTALREVTEETGLEVRIVAPVGAISYFFTQDGERIHKTVHFFLMEPTGGDLDDHDHEFDEVQWFPIHEAISMLSFDSERRLVEHALPLAGL